jgi:ABC-type branched-subunit amino acid transport system ATPase component
MGAILTVQGLSAGYYKAIIVEEVSLTIEKGQIVTLIGPNGCGKSTLIKAILGLVKKFKGEVYFTSTAITDMPTHRIIKLGIGYVPQVRNIFPNLTIQENLDMGAYARDDKDKISSDLEEMLVLFAPLRRRMNQKAQVLSGGEVQMLSMARALMSKPSLLIVDEPTASLSPKAAQEVIERIQQVRDQGITILQVEQNVKKALEISDRVSVMFSGKKVLEGSAEDILKNQDLGRVFLGVLPTGEVVG